MSEPCARIAELCDCDWHAVDVLGLGWSATTYRHGDNPEATRTFLHAVWGEAGRCERGHLLELERWMASVVEYGGCAKPLLETARD